MMNKNMKKDNKGFSLVELIIVIAIMAILIGVVALQVIPYLEKSRVGKDRQAVDTVYSAFQTSLAENEEAQTADMTITLYTKPSDATQVAVWENMAVILGNDAKTEAGMKKAVKLVSKSASGGDIQCSYNSTTKRIEVVATGDASIKSENKEQ